MIEHTSDSRCTCGHRRGQHAGPMKNAGNCPCCGKFGHISKSDCSCKDFLPVDTTDFNLDDLVLLEKELRN